MKKDGYVLVMSLIIMSIILSLTFEVFRSLSSEKEGLLDYVNVEKSDREREKAMVITQAEWNLAEKYTTNGVLFKKNSPNYKNKYPSKITSDQKFYEIKNVKPLKMTPKPLQHYTGIRLDNPYEYFTKTFRKPVGKKNNWVAEVKIISGRPTRVWAIKDQPFLNSLLNNATKNAVTIGGYKLDSIKDSSGKKVGSISSSNAGKIYSFIYVKEITVDKTKYKINFKITAKVKTNNGKLELDYTTISNKELITSVE